MPKFYVVEKSGVPAVWESDPKRVERLLKQKPGFAVTSATLSDTRAEALTKLRELFPGHRPLKA